jgi:hypothetical protein
MPMNSAPTDSDAFPVLSPPDDELGMLVEADRLVARSERAVIAVRSVVAYSTGVSIDLIILLREESNADTWREIVAGGAGTLLIGFGDDTSGDVETGPLYEPQLSSPPYWMGGSGGGGGRRYEALLWVNPIPVPGKLRLAVSWRDQEIPPTTVTLTIPTPAELAAGVTSIWPRAT